MDRFRVVLSDSSGSDADRLAESEWKQVLSPVERSDDKSWYYISGEWMYFNYQRCADRGQALPTDLYAISGTSDVTAAQMAERFAKSGFTYPAEALSKGGADTIEKFCEIVISEAKKENIKPEVVSHRRCMRPDGLQFGGDVKIEQFNFAGLGATGGGVPGNSFKDVCNRPPCSGTAPESVLFPR